ncbi:MAG TPA: RNA polymerase sigma factor [Sphingomicrobium sp.]
MNQASSFELELEGFLPRLRRFAHALSKNRADADDLLQSSVERALRARAKWQDGTRLDSWLYTIVRNQWIDTVRARARRSKYLTSLDEVENLGEDPRSSMDASIELKRMMGLMQRLPEDQREVVALILIEGFGYRETAEIVGVPIGTVSSRLVRGRNALLQLAETNMGGDEQ